MLQKLETAWLNILRAFVIIASGVLLVGAVVFGLSSLQGFGDGPGDEIEVPQVDSAALIRQMTAPATATTAADAGAIGSPAPAAGDDNKAFYDRATAAIATFVAQHANGAETVDRDMVYEITRSRAESLDRPELVTGYAQGFADSIEAILASEAVQKQAETSSALDVVNKALDLYSEEFNRQLEASQEAVTQAQQEHLQDKADASRNLYLALASFGLFLFIVFLSIFIRIERNLRHLEQCAREPRSGGILT